MAPSSPAAITLGVTTSGTTKPLLTALATAVPTRSAAAKLKVAAHTTAANGDSTRVPTMVAIEFAESWNPLMKSNANARTMMTRT